MNSYLNNKLARALQAEVRMRLATPADGAAVGRLAALDSSSVPTLPLLLAEQGGEVRVAVSLSGAAMIADPFRPTAALVEVLQTHATQLGRQHAPKHRSIRGATRRAAGPARPFSRRAVRFLETGGQIVTTSRCPAGSSIDQSEHLPKFLGIELDSVSAESVVARLAIRRELLAPNGYLHAATLIALADTACGYGTLAGLVDAGASFTTLEVKANFLATARHGTLLCHARRRHAGATTQVWDTEVTSDDRVLALFRCTQLVLKPQPTSPPARRTTRAGDLTGDLPHPTKADGGTVIDALRCARTGTPNHTP